MNAVIAIHPYKAKGMWVFDDPEVGLRQESFVSGADAIIDRMFKKFLMRVGLYLRVLGTTISGVPG
jgi:hypothetical protein